MKQFRLIPSLALILICTGSCSILEAQGVKEIAAAVDQHYNGLRSLQADFTEVYKGAGIERTESGTLLAEKTWQDALGIPFSEGEAVCLRRQERVALYSRPAAGAKNGVEEAGGFALAHRIPA